MIFVATGTQFPFDRLIRDMDEWANQYDEEVFAQIGEGSYEPKHMQWERFISMDVYNQKIRTATAFVSHAGMGNIISGRDNQVPTIVINRQAKLGEHRNDHQADGIIWMNQLDGVYGVSNKDDLYKLLEQRKSLACSSAEQNNAKLNQLVDHLDQLLQGWK